MVREFHGFGLPITLSLKPSLQILLAGPVFAKAGIGFGLCGGGLVGILDCALNSIRGLGLDPVPDRVV